jgi:CheY-like chemotaxis protein
LGGFIEALKTEWHQFHEIGKKVETQTILVVEDVTLILENLEEILEANGYSVLIATSGIEALEKLRAFKVDLVLCDVRMRGMTGIELLQVTRWDADLRNIPFIFLSALTSRREKEAGLAAGAVAYIIKPFYLDELLATIQQVLSQYSG